jgi:hypothetical protein
VRLILLLRCSIAGAVAAASLAARAIRTPGGQRPGRHCTRRIADARARTSVFIDEDKVDWQTEMSGRLARRIPDREARSNSSRPCITKPSAPASTRRWCSA